MSLNWYEILARQHRDINVNLANILGKIFFEVKMQEKAIIMDSLEIKRAIIRISHEIIEKNRGVENVCLLGIKTRGVPLAYKIQENINNFEDVMVPVGVLDVTQFRDDILVSAEQARTNKNQIGFDIVGKDIIVVDDVLYTGRTARASMEALIAIGRPKSVQLAVLIDRGHRELPIRADYIGKNLPTSREEIVKVYLDLIDNQEKVILYNKE